MNKNTSVKFCIPPLACPSANPCNPCHRSGIQHEKTTGTATAMETEEKNLIVHNCIRYNYWRKGEMTDIYMLSLSTENHYGIFSNYRMFVCPSEIINIIMKYAQYYCLAVNKTLIRERHN